MTKTKTNLDLVIDQLCLILDGNMNDGLEPTATDAFGRENRWHNASGFFLLGSRAAGSTRAYIKAQSRLDEAEDRYEEEVTRNGETSVKAQRIGDRLDKIMATFENARHLMQMDHEVFEYFQGEPFGGKHSDPAEQVAWFEKRVEYILNPEETAPVKRDLNAEMAARREAG